MQLFLEDENLILYVMVRCHFRTIFFSCNMYFQGTWNPYPLPIVLKNSMRNIRGAIKKFAFWASHWQDRNIGDQGKGIIWGPTSFWKCLSGYKAQKPLRKLSHSDWSKRITWWSTMSASLGNDTPFFFYNLPQGFLNYFSIKKWIYKIPLSYW